jgi:cytochrome P450
MMDYFLRPANLRTNEMIPGVSRLALNIQLAVQYNINPPWEQAGPVEKPTLVQKVARDLKLMLPVYGLMMVLPRRLLTLSIWPKGVQDAAMAAGNVPGELKSLLAVEREALQKADGGSHTFLSNMLRFLESEKEEAGDLGPRKSLTDKELIANLFLFTVASFDTTANTISYAIALLAIHPEWQDWIMEEVDAVSAEHPLTVDDFTKMPRCLALMVCLPLSPLLLKLRCSNHPLTTHPV